MKTEPTASDWMNKKHAILALISTVIDVDGPARVCMVLMLHGSLHHESTVALKLQCRGDVSYRVVQKSGIPVLILRQLP